MCQVWPGGHFEQQKRIKILLQGTLEPNQVASIVEEGRALIQGGDAQQAVGCFVKAAEADPSNPKVWNDLGVALFITDQIQPAIEAFQTSIRYDATFPDAYINLATAASKTGDTQLTQHTLNQAMEALPHHAEIQAVYRDLSQEETAPVAKPAEESNPTTHVADPVEEHVIRGRQCVAEGRVTEACQFFLKALELEPTCAPAWNDLGVAMFSNGEHLAAFEAFQTCLTHDPSFSDAVLNMVAAAERVGKVDDAILALQGLLAINPSHTEAREALTKLEKSTDQGDAERQTAALHLMHEGRESLGQEDYAGAGRKFLEATEVAPGFAPPWNDLGVALYLEEHNDLSYQAFETSLQLSPGFVDAAINLAKCAIRVGRENDAKKWVDAALAKNPGDQDLIAAIATMEGAPVEAPAVQDAVAPQAAPATAQAVQGVDMMKAIDTDVPASQTIEEMAAAMENILLKGRELVMEGQYVSACNTFMDAISMDLTCAIAWNDLGVALYQSESYESSIEAFETAMMHDPQLADVPINMANALRKMGQNSAALNVLKTAMIRCPEDQDIQQTFERFSKPQASATPQQGLLASVQGQSYAVIDIDSARANAKVTTAKQHGATQATVHAPTEVRDGLVKSNMNPTDVVYCGEVLERVPNPAQTLSNLRQIATNTVIVTTRCVPSNIEAPAGSIQFTGTSACFVPAAGLEVKSILESYEMQEGRDVEFINGTAVEGGWLLGSNSEPKAVWWAWTDQFVHQMIESAGFSVVKMEETQEKGVKAFVCRVA
jgi:Flp pilus assembly protein TadD